jgi:hypothetical protein
MMAYARLLLAEVTATLRVLGLTIRKTDSEYRVNFKGGTEATAYYTTDINDALETGAAMAERARHKP